MLDPHYRVNTSPDDITDEAWILELEDIQRDTSRILKRETRANRQVRSEKSKFDQGNVLYGRLRPYLNKVVVADAPGFCSTELLVLRCGPGLEPIFVLYWLKHPTFRQYAEQASHGMNMPRLSSARLANAPFRLAPVEQQRQIVEIVEPYMRRLDEVEDALNAIPAVLQRTKEAATTRTLQQAFLNSEGREARISDVSVRTAYGTSRKSQAEGLVPVLRMGNIVDGRIDWTNLQFTSYEPDIENYALRDGDLLFNRTNSPELVGKTAVFRSEQPAIPAGYLIKVTLDENVHPEYVAHLLNSPMGRAYCREVKVDGLSQSNINSAKLSAFKFPLPPLEEQVRISEQLDDLFEDIDSLKAERARIAEDVGKARESMLVHAFDGKLTASSKEDSSVTELLTRLGRFIAESRSTLVEERLTRRRENQKVTKIQGVSGPAHEPLPANFLTLLLTTLGSASPEALWEASSMHIDEFYEQLRREVEVGLIVERPADERDESRILELA